MKKSILGFVLIGVLLSCHKETATDLIYQTDFNSGNGTWYKSCSSETCFKYDQGKYKIEIDVPSYDAWAYAPCGLINGTYSMSADCSIQLDDDTKWGSAGFIYNRINSSSYKVFLISTYGHYAIFQVANGAFTALKDWTPSGLILTDDGVTNSIMLLQQSNSIEFRINNISIGTFPHSQSYNFKVGLVAGSSSDYTKVVGSFDNLVIRKLH